MSEKMAGMVTVNINGLLIQVDLETAQSLNDDPVFRDQYESLVRAQITPKSPVANINTESFPDGVAKTFLEGDWQEPDQHQLEQSLSEKTLIWTSRKPTSNDVQATYHFLDLRRQMSHEFDDQKNCKNSLWQKIAKSLNQNAFYVGNGPEATEKCRKKFANLQSSYMKYNDKKRQTGEGKVLKPPYYDEIDAILGTKDKVNPQIIIDSIKMKQVQETSVGDKAFQTRENLPSTSKIFNSPSTSNASGSTEGGTSYNKFENIKSSVRPSDKNKLMGELVILQKEEMEERKVEFNRMMTFLEKESAQRHEQIMSLLKKSDRGKKRKRESDSDTN